MSIPLVKNNRKVLVSFKCNSSLKTDLCVESGKLGITLSSYVENIVENQSNHQIEVANLKKQVFDLSERLSSYETPFLKKMFEMHKGETLSYINNKGETIEITIDNIVDVYTLIIHSFKTVDK